MTDKTNTEKTTKPKTKAPDTTKSDVKEVEGNTRVLGGITYSRKDGVWVSH